MSYTSNSSKKEIAKRVDILVDGAINTAITLTAAQSSFNTQTINVSYTTAPVSIQLKLYYDVQEYWTNTEYSFYYGYNNSTEWRIMGPTPDLDTLTKWYLLYANNPDQYWVLPIGFGSNVVYNDGAYLYKSESSGWMTTQQNASVVSNKQTIYLKPKKFYFLGDDKGSLNNVSSVKVYLDKGLQDALPNIYKFNEAATQWRKWKNQQETYADCNAFQKGRLTAAMMNNAATYIGANIGDFTAGPLRLTKKMFETLENKLNE